MWFSNAANQEPDGGNQNLSARGPQGIADSATRGETSGSETPTSSSNNSTDSGQNLANQQRSTGPMVAPNAPPSSNFVQQPAAPFQATKLEDKISFHFKTSIFTRRVTIDSDKMALGLIKQLAIAFLNEVYFQHYYPTGTYIGDYIKKHFSSVESRNSLCDRLVLRKYNCQSESFLSFNSVSDIEPESYISVEVSEKQQQQHLLSSANLIGTSLVGSLVPSAPTISQSMTTHQQIKISHEFKPESFLFPTHCASCSTLIKGVIRQGFQCGHCRKNYCPKCKTKAEATGESCLASSLGQQGSNLVQQSGPNNSSSVDTHNPNNSVANSFFPANTANNSSSTHNLTQNVNSSANKLEIAHSSMSKRKSASNLLHFNIANPFRSHYVKQQQQQQNQTPQTPKEDKPKTTRGSAGALDPILQQLERSREQSQQQKQQTGESIPPATGGLLENGNSLLLVAQAHLSSSHQNLFVNSDRVTIKEVSEPEKLSAYDTSPSSNVHQTSLSRGHVNQLSNSARNSATDLHSISPTKRDLANHSFICMDWIQLSGEPACGVCNKPLKIQQNQKMAPPFMCKACKLQVHAQCQNLVLADCLTRIAESSRAAAERKESDVVDDKVGIKNTNSNLSRDNIRLHRLAPSVKHVKRPDLTKPIIEGWLKHTTLSDEQARQHYWRLDDTDITLYENDTSTRYFKAIALSKITRVMSAQSLPKIVREDVLMSNVLVSGGSNKQQDKNKNVTKSANTSPIKTPELQAQMKAMFAFELTTGSMYLVQASSEVEASRWKESLASVTAKKDGRAHNDKRVVDCDAERASTEAKLTGLTSKNDMKQPQDQTIAQRLEAPGVETEGKAINEATTPRVVAREKQQPKQPPVQRQQYHHYPPSGLYRGQHKTYTDPSRSRLYNRPRKIIQLNPMLIPDHWIEGKYLIERDRVKGVGFEELGSGQFGKVYAAISEWKAEDPVKGLWSGVPVAIKEISKARFDLRQQAKLKNEANILSRLDHPGVIILERVHDLADKIYIVMEQLEDDMLEMIVSTEEKRLNERITKFLTYQILEALKYLHAQNIAHCDLKPENVLLVERRSQFPQIKLCDFGFAKIIEDNSFRSSLVGTPAYLAPEVVKGERYNRSVDLWSVGVIVYVSLSGEFPFNEGENIHDQISRANFMYPDQPWAKISTQAKNFINSLLRVNCEKRLSANRAQMDDWIQVCLD